MDKIFLDTSFLISYYNTLDENHLKVEEMMNKLSEGDFEVLISDYIFSECCTVLLLRLKDFKKSIQVCEAIKSIEMLKVNDLCFEKTWSLFKEQNKTKMSFTDCSTQALMDINGIKQIATFDEDFGKVKGIRVFE